MAGIESLLPALVAVVVALTLKRTVIALFVAVWVGGLVISQWHPMAGLEQAFEWITAVVTDEWNARFLILISLLGSGAALMHRIGGSAALAASLSRRIATARQVQFLAYILGLLVFFNDYINTVIVGNATRSLARKYRVSTEKMSYILDSTAAPVATIGPVSDWIGYQVGLIAAVFAASHWIGASPYVVFLQSIPWNFYCVLTLVAVPTIIFFGEDFGPMRDAEQRSHALDQPVAPGDVPLSDVEDDLGEVHEPADAGLHHFILPIVALLAGTAWGAWQSAGPEAGISPGAILAEADISVALLAGAVAMTFTGLLLAVTRGMNLGDCEHAILAGFRTMLPALVIMILAWSIAAACDALGTADYVRTLTAPWMTSAMLPLVVFLTAAVISFTTGSSWGAMAILTPIALPIAMGLTESANDMTVVQIVIGATFSGAVFGDHCSPISDTTVMSSIFGGADHIAHVRTQIPYALLPAGISTLLYVGSAVIDRPAVLLLLGIGIQLAIIRWLGKRRRIAPEMSAPRYED
ncbi:Na+/H+ antiporter NhaC family protein [Haliea sp. E1-2-M8]|uniref:Na+/H+ antiporter NhaC family protein n=1 Tax=Haliea sp. E1-2-M8 TaxID=3064706 RepID=UPI002715CF57|nr:Na+/H+ antiporter NhaC family protein [Haliea sp. E1-2-M8]MDO8861737.1 Na+/H+ antiporter NhaC family protein [Haliea sp. E1-2-M8]